MITLADGWGGERMGEGEKRGGRGEGVGKVHGDLG